MKYFLNGCERNYDGDPERNLLAVLRDDEKVITPKDGCSGEGSCGACTVQLEERSVLSCVTPMKRVEGKRVETTDGMEQRIQDAFARSFVKMGGIQCGFCIPGIVMSAKVLLLKNENPTRSEIETAINKNLCRCTGYKKIVDSIELAAKVLRGESELPEIVYHGKVGERVGKYDSELAVLGLRPFVCDLREEGMVHAALKFTDHPRAEVKSIDISKAQAADGVLSIMTAKDIPGEKIIGLIVKDWPLMIGEGEETHHLGDSLAIVVAETEQQAREAVELIQVEYEVRVPIETPQTALKEGIPSIHPGGNLLSETVIKRGDMEEAKNRSAYVAKGTYTTQRIEHAFMEPECAMVRPKDSGVEVFSQGQGPYVDRMQIAAILGLNEKSVKVVQVPNGGGFGGKEDLSIQGHAALASFITKKPVRLCLSRSESLRLHPKRHPLEMYYELGCDEKGKLTFLKADIVGDTGAYASVGMKVLERAAGHASSAYNVPVVDINAKAVYTNNVPCGAMRGFGVNQTAFAMEGSIEELCRMGSFDRWQFRYDNALQEGDRVTTGQVLEGGVGVKETLLAIKDDFQKARYAGIGCGIKNSGIGNGMKDVGRIKVVVEDAESISIHHGWTEMGQGVHTVAIQSFCEELTVRPRNIRVVVETDQEVECGMTTSSRATVMVGNALIEAAKKMNQDLTSSSLSDLVGREYNGEWVCDWTTKPGSPEEREKGAVTHYSYSYASQLAILNDQGEVEKIVAAHDGGRVYNPTLFEGQIEGSVHMGLGYALTEDFPMRECRPIVTQLKECGILRAKNTPEIVVVPVEVADPHGPYGAKGVGEIGLVPTAGAVANALYQYDNIRRYQLPLKRK